jgi:hypothetical protein
MQQETQLLRDQNILPTEEVLKAVLEGCYTAFEELMKTIENIGLIYEWRYYKDGKSWLCNVSYKKKTIFWLSVWDTCFKLTFFFTEKHLSEIAELDISEKIKTDFALSKPIGRLLPLLINIDKDEQLPDVLKIIEFKKTFK